MTEIADYHDYAKAAAEFIKSAGFNTQLHKLGIVSVTINGRVYYVNLRPIKNYESIYGPNCKIEFDQEMYLRIIGKNDYIQISHSFVTIYGKRYYHRSGKQCMGQLYNNIFTSMVNTWVLYGNCTNVIKILDKDFNQVNTQKVDIKHIGNSTVEYSSIYQTDIDAFTIFSDPPCIVEGKYEKSGRDDIFKYIDGNGELYALLSKFGERTLNSKTKEIKLTNLTKCKVHKEDGLYTVHRPFIADFGGPLIADFGKPLIADFGNKYLVKNDTNFDVFYFNYTFFTYSVKKFIELEARLLNGGKHTKPAASSAAQFE